MECKWEMVGKVGPQHANAPGLMSAAASQREHGHEHGGEPGEWRVGRRRQVRGGAL